MASALLPSPCPVDKNNYARLCRLLTVVGFQALKDTFDTIHPPAELHGDLRRPPAHPTLQSLKKNGIISTPQWRKLYPIIPSSVSSGSFDISLLMLLLKNICGLKPLATMTGWDSRSPVEDKSIEANIARLTHHRNRVYELHTIDSFVDDSTFNAYWEDISNVLVGLGAGEIYWAEINRLKTATMDSELVEHYQELLKEWKKDDDYIKGMERKHKDEKGSPEDEIGPKRETEEDEQGLSLLCCESLPRLNIKLTKPSHLPKKIKRLNDSDLPIDILLLTVEDCEFRSCFSYLDEPFKIYFYNIGYVYFGFMGDGEEKLKIALTKCPKVSSVPSGALPSLKNAINVLQPKATFSVGTCTGLSSKKTKLGDVVVPFRLTTHEFSTPVSSNIGHIIRDIGYGWIPPLENPDEREVCVHCEGEVLSLPQAASFGLQCEDIMQQHPGAIAIETEGEGVFAAAHNDKIEWMIVKGIAGYGDPSPSPNYHKWMSFASAMAASVVAKVLADPDVFKKWPHYNSAPHINIRVDIEKITRPGVQGEAHRDTVPSEEHQTMLRGENVPVSSKNGPAAATTACERENDKNERVPSASEILRSIASGCSRSVNHSNPEERNGFLHYLQEVRKLLVVDTHEGSLIFTVQCSSLEILEELWKDFSSGHLKEMAQQYLVTDDILRVFGQIEVKVTTAIQFMEYEACKDFFLQQSKMMLNVESEEEEEEPIDNKTGKMEEMMLNVESEEEEEEEEPSDKKTGKMEEMMLDVENEEEEEEEPNEYVTGKMEEFIAMTEEAASSRTGDHSKDLTDAPPPLSIKLPQLSDLPKTGKPWRDVHLPVDILLWTVEDCEFLACYAYMRNSFKSYRRELGYVYFGNVGDGDEPLKIALVKSQEGSSDPGCLQTVITNAVMCLQPKAVYSVGCCIGLNIAKTQLGDVMVSTKLTTETFKTPVGRDIAMIVKHAADRWKPPLESTDARKVNVHCNGDILSGMDQDTAKRLSELNSQAIAVEREGKGIFVAPHDLKMEWVIVKGVADFAGDSKTPSASWKSFACVMAASVVFNMLSDPVVFEDWPHYQGGFCLEECQKQLRSFYDSRSKVKIVPWDPSSAVPIDEMYTKLSWLADDRKPIGVTQRKIEAYTDIFRSRNHCAEPKRILVYGRPGIGKTVFTLKTAFDWSQQRNQMLSKFDLVLLVKLRDVRDLQDVPSILKASEVLASDGKISVDDLYAYILRHQEKVMLILDGYDEYSAGKQSPIRDIWERKLLRDCCVIVTTRQMKTDELRSPSDGQFEINGLDSEDQIKRFAKKFLNDEKSVEEFWKYLKKQNLEDIAKIPLLLLMLCLVWKENHFTELPSSRANIYTQFIQTFLNHMSAKDTDAGVSRKIGDYAEELSRLGKLALDALLRESLFLSLREVPGDLLTEKLIEVGLFQVSNLSSVNPDKGVFFIHRSVQEFLAAWYLRDELLSRKSENPTPLLKFDSIDKLFNIREALQFASELSEEAAWEIVSHLGSVAKKESVTEYHFLDTHSVYDFTPAQSRFQSLILDAFFCCSPKVRRERVSVFLSYVGCCLRIDTNQLQSFAEEHLLKYTTPPNYIFFCAEQRSMDNLTRSVYQELYNRCLIMVLEDVDAVVVGCSGEKRAADFFKKHAVSSGHYLLSQKEERMYLHISMIKRDHFNEYLLPIEMLKELVASSEPTQQEERDANQSEQDSRSALCLTENTTRNPSTSRHCLSLVAEISVFNVDRSEVETLTEILPLVTSPSSILILGDRGKIILGAELTKSLVSRIPFTDKLHSLYLVNLNLTAESVTIIATSLHQTPNLEVLYLSENPLGEGVSVLTRHLSCVPYLDELALSGVKMTKKQVNDLTTAVRQSDITELRSDYHDEKGNPLPEDEWPSGDESEDESGDESEDESRDESGDESEDESRNESGDGRRLEYWTADLPVLELSPEDFL